MSFPFWKWKRKGVGGGNRLAPNFCHNEASVSKFVIKISNLTRRNNTSSVFLFLFFFFAIFGSESVETKKLPIIYFPILIVTKMKEKFKKKLEKNFDVK